MKFIVHLMTISHGQAEVEASSLGEAYELAQDLTAGDFEFIDGTDQWREIKEVPMAFCNWCGDSYESSLYTTHHCKKD